MRRCICLFYLLLLLFALTSNTVFAHPGKTDEDGGHYDSDTGSYHYHHGYPAHYHTGGSCPYVFDDMTGEGSGSSSSGFSSGNVSSDYKNGYQSGYDDAEKQYENALSDQKEKTITIAIWVGIVSASVSAIIVYYFARKWINGLQDTHADTIKEYTKNKQNLIEIMDAQEAKITSYRNCVEKQTSIIRNHRLHQQQLHALLQESIGTEYLYVLSKTPIGHYLDKELLPHSSGADDYIVYLGSQRTANSTHYHTKHCRYANQALPFNVYSVKNNCIYKPCMFCNRYIPDTSWVDRYIYHHRHLKENVE